MRCTGAKRLHTPRPRGPKRLTPQGRRMQTNGEFDMRPTRPTGLPLAITIPGAGAAATEDVTRTIEDWRNDDLPIWQDKIIPAFAAAKPGIKVQ